MNPSPNPGKCQVCLRRTKSFGYYYVLDVPGCFLHQQHRRCIQQQLTEEGETLYLCPCGASSPRLRWTQNRHVSELLPPEFQPPEDRLEEQEADDNNIVVVIQQPEVNERELAEAVIPPPRPDSPPQDLPLVPPAQDQPADAAQPPPLVMDPDTSTGTYCGPCRKRFKHRETMKRHKATHHPGESDKWRCNVCQKEYTRRDKLIEHHHRAHDLQHPVLEKINPRGEVTLIRV